MAKYSTELKLKWDLSKMVWKKMKKILILIILISTLVACKEIEEVKWDRIPMFMYQDNFYYEKKYTRDAPEDIVYDGKFDSTVVQTELPTKNGESNFGIYEYVLMDDGTIEIYLGDSKWVVYQEEIR